MTSYDALTRMARDRQAQLLSEAGNRRLAGRRPAGRRARRTAASPGSLSPPLRLLTAK